MRDREIEIGGRRRRALRCRDRMKEAENKGRQQQNGQKACRRKGETSGR